MIPRTLTTAFLVFLVLAADAEGQSERRMEVRPLAGVAFTGGELGRVAALDDGHHLRLGRLPGVGVFGVEAHSRRSGSPWTFGAALVTSLAGEGRVTFECGTPANIPVGTIFVCPSIVVDAPAEARFGAALFKAGFEPHAEGSVRPFAALGVGVRSHGVRWSERPSSGTGIEAGSSRMTGLAISASAGVAWEMWPGVMGRVALEDLAGWIPSPERSMKHDFLLTFTAGFRLY